MNLHANFSKTLLFLTMLLGILTQSFSQVISTPTLIPILTPLTTSYTVSGSTMKRVNINLTIDANYANLTLLAGDVTLLDNIDVPLTGTHDLNAIVVFPTTGEQDITIMATGRDITINSFEFTDIELEFPDYTEITEELGLIDNPSLKYGGPSIADMDNDGDYDLVLNNHNDATSILYWNNGDGTVTKHDADLSKWYMMDLHGSAAGDYDNDGDLDLVIALGGGNGTSPQPPVFYKNENGNLIRSATEVGVTSGARGRCPRWSDLDLDGDLDLILINAAGTNGAGGEQHIFYTNNGNGTFTTVNVPGIENASAERVLVTDLNNDYIDDLVLFSPLSVWQGNGNFTFTEKTDDWLPPAVRRTWGIMAATDIDIDNDGDFDLYLSSGEGYFDVAQGNSVDFYPAAKKLDMRLSGSSGRSSFELIADSLILYEFSHVGRSTYDGDFPIFLGSSKTSVLIESDEDSLTITQDIADGWPETRSANGLYIGYVGEGVWNAESVRNGNLYWSIHLSFSELTEFSSTFTPNNRNVQDVLLRNDNGSFVDVSNSWNIPKGGNHWGVTTGDFNNDTYQDLYVYRFGYLKNRLSDYMLINTGEENFEITTCHAANVAGANSHGDMGQAFDFDLDGDVDILNGDDEYGVWHMYQNEKTDENNYAIVKVGYSPISNVDPISADITLSTQNDTFHKRVGSTGEVFSQSLLNMVHFGLGEADSVKNVTIRWRNGETAFFNDKQANQIFDTDLVDPTNLTVSPQSDSVRVDTEIELEIDVEPNYANRDVWWSSLNETIASVDSLTGIVTGHVIDQTTKIVATSYANELTDTAIIKVVSWYSIPVDSVTVTPESVELIQGNTISLAATIYPKYADDDSVLWSSNNTNVATVNDDGLVTTHEAGTVTIKATLEANDNISDQSNIIVNELVAQSLTVVNESIHTTTAYVKNGTLEITADYHAGTGNTVVSSIYGGVKFWFRHMNASWGVISDIIVVDDDAVGTESGTSRVSIPLTNVTPSGSLTDGEFYFLYVVFESSEGVISDRGIWPITVINTPGISITPTDLTLSIGETSQLITEISPANVKDTTVSWSSVDEAIAMVSNDGVVTANALGTTTIQARTAEGNASATCNITVAIPESLSKLVDPDRIIIYPNPVTDQLTIKGTTESTFEVRITNLEGKACLSKKINGSQTLNIGGLSKGSYVVKVVGNNSTQTFNLIKM